MPTKPIPMTPESRAKEAVVQIIDDLLRNGGVTVGISERWASAVASAIRSAENDKLEEARQRVLEGHDEAWGNPAEQHGWDQAAQRIEALKSKD